MKVRQVDASKASVATLLNLLQLQCLPDDKPADVSKGHWWIAYDDSGAPVAFAGLYPSARWSDAGYLCRSGVLPEYRGNGLQKRLIKVRLSMAKKLGYNWLLSDTRANPASSNSLISCGFRLYEPSIPWSFKNALYFRRKL